MDLQRPSAGYGQGPEHRKADLCHLPLCAVKAFDAEVAKGNNVIRDLAEKHFITLRQVEMKGVDLSLFQFDYDVNWAGMFINADGVVYARYGTQSTDGPDAYNSIAGLKNTMDAQTYPTNKVQLAGKRGAPKPYKTAMEMPGLENKQAFRQTTHRNNCIHCHNIHDAENHKLHLEGKLTKDKLWRYPLPENVGLNIDAVDGQRIAKVLSGSAADRAGLKAGQRITHANGQPITSIADIICTTSVRSGSRSLEENRYLLARFIVGLASTVSLKLPPMIAVSSNSLPTAARSR